MVKADHLLHVWLTTIASNIFQKKYNNQIVLDEEDFSIYKRRNNGNTVTKNGVKLDNAYVVPYSRNLLIKYQAHINVEFYNHSWSIKYLFKYINKGHDIVSAVIEKINVDSVHAFKSRAIEVDEIKAYLDCRYILVSEACWRIFELAINCRDPSVERINFYLSDEQTIVFAGTANLKN